MKCEIVTGNMPQLWEDLLSQLHEKEYPSESIRHYREAMGRVDRYMRENQILEYTEAVGETYLATHGGRISSGRQFYMSFYVRRLNDILNKRPYVVVHTRKKQKDLKHFSGVFERFDEMLCKQSISDGTRKLQDLYCYEFLHFVEQQGISDLKEINAQILYAAFSASGSKENFRCAVRKLMKYLYQEQIHPLNLAEFVPAVRRAKPMPSLPYSDYNPESAVLFCILLRMLYGCGLRRNEALKMETRDIDLNLGVLFVRHAKNDKQRYVPMDISLTELIRAYLSIVPQREYLFVNSTSGRRYSAEWARKRMGHLLQDCGIDFERVRKYERGPCLHCFRHTFVAKAFDQLLQTPLDFADAVPFISTYLGHCDLRETDKYLQANYDFFQRDHTLITDYTRKHNIFPEVIDE